MSRLWIAFPVVLTLAVATAPAPSAQTAPAGQPRIYNTVKTKLKAGRQVVGGTVLSPDPDIYCAMASSGFDFTWIEMQHSPLSYIDVARMLMACKGSPAIPFIRVPDAAEGDIQKATDSFFQGPNDAQLLRTGIKVELGGQPAGGQPRGVAPIEGSERR